MIGAILGDIVGSRYEFSPIKTKAFPLFGPGCTFYRRHGHDGRRGPGDCWRPGETGNGFRRPLPPLRQVGRAYPDVGYGRRFTQWLASDAPCVLPQLWQRLRHAGLALRLRGPFAGGGHGPGGLLCCRHT